MVHVAITIDTECDKDPKWRIRRPLTFRGIHEGVGERLQPLFDRHGVVPTYFLSPEVIADDASVHLFSELGARAELGTHLHAEFIDPESDPDAPGTDRMQNSFRREIESAKLEALTGAFIAAFGFRPTSFRAGRFGIGTHSLSILEGLGYLVDSSVAPFSSWNDPGGTVDFMKAIDRLYYHPDAGNFLAEGAMEIVEIPVTISSPFWWRVPAEIRPSLMRSRLLGRRVRRMFGTAMKPMWLRPWMSSVDQMVEAAERTIARHRGESIVPLVMMFHNVEVIPGCSPYPQTEEEATRYLGDLERFIAYGVSKGWKFEGMGAIAERIMEKIT